MTASAYPLLEPVSPHSTLQRASRETISLRLLASLALVTDGAALVSVAATSALAAGLAGSGSKTGEWLLAILIAVATALALLRRQGSTIPQSLADVRRQLMPTALALLAAAIVGAASLSVSDIDAGRIAEWELFWLCGSSTSLAAARLVLAGVVRFWRKTGRLDYKVAVVGDPHLARAFTDRATIDPRFPIRVAGVYGECADDDPGDQGSDSPLAVRGDIDTLLLDCRLRTIDAIAITSAEADAAAELMPMLRHCAADIYLVPRGIDPLPKGARVRLLGACPVIALAERPLQGWQALAKVTFDKVVALALLAALLPLLGVVAVLIRLDSPGPILFRQLRTGYNNALFPMLKFRTMHHHLADRRVEAQTALGDSRVTRLGRILRKLSIDELPQLINVLRGDMSLVGPRPHAPGTAVGGVRLDDLVTGYASRHRVRPGLTGLAQVSGSRGCMSTPQQVAERLRHDLDYIENWSLWLDCKILMLTVIREIFSSRAF